MFIDKTMKLYPSGTIVDPCHIRVSEVHLSDIVHALSHINRFGGHTAFGWSVGQHSILVYEAFIALYRAQYQVAPAPAFCRAVILHDKTEIILGDIVRGLKYSPLFEAYRTLENVTDATMDKALGLPARTGELKVLCKTADNLVVEREMICLRQPKRAKAAKLLASTRYPNLFTMSAPQVTKALLTEYHRLWA